MKHSTNLSNLSSAPRVPIHSWPHHSPSLSPTHGDRRVKGVGLAPGPRHHRHCLHTRRTRCADGANLSGARSLIQSSSCLTAPMWLCVRSRDGVEVGGGGDDYNETQLLPSEILHSFRLVMHACMYACM